MLRPARAAPAGLGTATYRGGGLSLDTARVKTTVESATTPIAVKSGQ